MVFLEIYIEELIKLAENLFGHILGYPPGPDAQNQATA